MLPTLAFEGTITKDPVLAFTAGGIAVATFNVAVNERKKDETGKYVNGDASYYTCNVWRTQAENVVESLKKGDTVVVVGKVKMKSWEKEGVKRSSAEVEVDSVGISLRWETFTKNAVKDEKPDPWENAPF